MSFDTILKALGENGKYQLTVFFFMVCAKGIAAIPMFMPILVGYHMAYICRDGIGSATNISDIFSSNNSDFLRINNKKYCEKNATCSEWIFHSDIMKSSIMSQYQLVCGRHFLINVSTSLFFLGIIIGTILSGYFSDKYGRLRSLQAFTTLTVIFSLAAAFAPRFWIFACLRVFVGMGCVGMLTTLFAITTEVFTASNRVLFAFTVHEGLTAGVLLFTFFGYFVRDHFWLQLISTLPSSILLLSICFVLESPRWLHARGDMQGTERVLRQIAKRNGVDFEKVAPLLEAIRIDHPSMLMTRREQLAILVCSGTLVKNFFCSSLCFFAANLSFYGSYLSINSLLGGSVFMTTVTGAVVEIPARILGLFIAHRWGRRPNVLAAFLIGGISFGLSAAAVGLDHLQPWQIAAAMVGKFWATDTLEAMWLYSAELFPTSVRNMGISMSNLVGRFGALLAAHVATMGIIWMQLPFVTLSAVMLLAALVTLLLPETRNRELPEVMDFASGTSSVVVVPEEKNLSGLK